MYQNRMTNSQCDKLQVGLIAQSTAPVSQGSKPVQA